MKEEKKKETNCDKSREKSLLNPVRRRKTYVRRETYKMEGRGKKKKIKREGERKLEERSQVCNTCCLSDVARGRRRGDREKESRKQGQATSRQKYDPLFPLIHKTTAGD